MNKLTALAIVALVATAPAAVAQDTQILFMSGNLFETGGFPPSNIGDELSAVGVLNEIGNPLQWDTQNYRYTWWIRNLYSLGETTFGDVHVATYSGGLFSVYVDWLPPNESYGIDPPNVSAPSTFVDGISTYLNGYFTGFSLNYNATTRTGTFSGTLTFTDGDVYSLLTATNGWTFASNLADFAPTGYDSQVNGQVQLLVVSVEEETFGGIKALYR